MQHICQCVLCLRLQRKCHDLFVARAMIVACNVIHNRVTARMPHTRYSCTHTSGRARFISDSIKDTEQQNKHTQTGRGRFRSNLRASNTDTPQHKDSRAKERGGNEARPL